MMKIATFNMENLFHRDSRLVKRTMEQSLTSWVEEFEKLICKSSRGDNDISRMRELSFLLGFHKSSLDPYVVMRRKAGQLFLRKRNSKHDQRASPVTSWNGWVKVHSKPIHKSAIENKAKLISEINPDVLVVQEVEDRQSLLEFNRHYLPEGVRFTHIYLLAGNSESGREMAVLVKNRYQVVSLKSHGGGTESSNRIFAKDLQEYRIKTPTGNQFSLLSMHFEDQDPDPEVSEPLRRRQAERTAKVYQDLLAREKNVLLVGTLNSPSYSNTLTPLLRQTDLQDIKKHQGFTADSDIGKGAGYFSLGAYRMGINIKQKDYILISPVLFNRLNSCGLSRRGIYPEKKGQWKCYPSVQAETHQASSHPIIWGEIKI